MTYTSPAVQWVRLVADRLGPLVDQVVFLGGATLALLVTDQTAPTARPTKDVDVIVEVATYATYVAFQEKLRSRGFCEDLEEGAPLCRWLVDDIKVDVMPTTGDILGFTNRWYTHALKSAVDHRFDDDLTIRLRFPRRQRLPDEPRHRGHCCHHRWPARAVA